MGLRAAIYDRVSKVQGRDNRSVPEQETENRTVCADEGWQVAEVYNEPPVSASKYATKAREEWQRLMGDLSGGKFDVLVLWESSRGSRKLGEWASLLDACEERSVRVHVTSHDRTYDMTNPRDRRSLASDGVDSEYESGKSSQRIRRTVRANAAAGRPHGRLLYGYRREYDPETKAFLRQLPREDQAAVVREMAQRVVAGKTCYSIAKDFRARGIPAPRGGQWSPEQVREQLLNPGYIAKRTHKGKVIGDAVWPPILDEVTYHTCKRLLTDPSRRTMRESAIRHLLSGIVACGVKGCGAPLRVVKNRGVLSYSCMRCFGATIVESKLDAWIAGGEIDGVHVTGVVPKRLSRPDILELLAAGNGDEEARQARAKAVELRQRLEEFYDEAAKPDGPSPAALARIEARLLPEIEALEAKATRTIPPLVREIAGPDAGRRWHGLTMEQKRSVIRVLMEIRLLPVGKGKRTFDPRRVEITWR
jgi:site-specific DNA recombinase